MRININSRKSGLLKLRYYLKLLREKGVTLTLEKQQEIKEKVLILFKRLSKSMGMPQLRHALGTVLLASLALGAQAQNFAAPVDTFASNFQGVLIPGLGDMDNDGDLDVIGLGVDYGLQDFSIMYAENVGDPQNPDFAVPQFDPFNINIDFVQSIYTIAWDPADIDGDGDLDLISLGLTYDYNTYTYAGRMAFIENTGTPETPEFANAEFFDVDLLNHLSREMTISDFDGDGDMDFLALGGFYNETDYSIEANVLYMENITEAGGEFTLAETVMNPLGASTIPVKEAFEEAFYYFSSVDAADFDNDGDIDMIMHLNSYYQEYGTNVLFAENVDGAFLSWEEIESAKFPFEGDGFILSEVGDLDSDGDMDILWWMAGDNYDGDTQTNFVFVENLADPSNVQDQVRNPFSIYPTVTTGDLQIQFDREGTSSMTIIDVNGKQVRSEQNFIWSDQQSMDVSDLERGTYFLRLNDGEQAYTATFFKK